MKERKLGRGLDTLFSATEEKSAEEKMIGNEVREEKTAGGEKKERYAEIATSRIMPNKNQPRRHFEEELIVQLAQSIKTEGIVQPIIVRKKDDSFELVSGERRWRAAQRAGLKTLPAIIMDDIDDNRSLQIALIENIQREDLNPIEKANAFKEILKRTECTQEDLSEKIGLDRSTLANFIRLLELPAEVQEAVSRGTISMGHARALLSLTSEKDRKSFARRIEREGISVRRLENIIKLSGRTSSRKSVSAKDPLLIDISEKLSTYFGTKVLLKTGKKRGRIIIDYFDVSQLNEILDKLGIVV